jgi:membrane-associated phospholipid phosphatase
MVRATFLVTVASARKPHWRSAGWLLVGAMAFTRVYCNEHWVSDVVGGALLGWILALIATTLEHEAGVGLWNGWRRKADEQEQQESRE